MLNCQSTIPGLKEAKGGLAGLVAAFLDFQSMEWIMGSIGVPGHSLVGCGGWPFRAREKIESLPEKSNTTLYKNYIDLEKATFKYTYMTKVPKKSLTGGREGRGCPSTMKNRCHKHTHLSLSFRQMKKENDKFAILTQWNLGKSHSASTWGAYIHPTICSLVCCDFLNQNW